jgi:hypothetical protein
MARPKLEDKKKVMYRVFVPRSYIPVLDQVIKNLNEVGMADQVVSPESKTEPVVEDKPIKKASFGIDANDWIAKNTDKVVNVEEKEFAQKDYTAWQSDPLMQDIYNSCLWDAGGEDQCYPDGVEEYQRKYKDLWGKLNEAKRNNKTQRCNEIMTEMMERIYNE